jgi:hypothetical protein
MPEVIHDIVNEAADAFTALVRRAADGQEVEQTQIDRCAEAAGKAPEEFGNAVRRLIERRKLRAIVDRPSKEAAEMKQAEDSINTEFNEVGRRRQEVLRQIGERRAQGVQLSHDAANARRILIETADPAIAARLSEISHEITQAQKQMPLLQGAIQQLELELEHKQRAKVQTQATEDKLAERIEQRLALRDKMNALTVERGELTKGQLEP